MAHLQEIIVTETSRGRGEEHDPHRNVIQFWSKDGQLMSESDPCQPQYDSCKSEWIIPARMKTRVEALEHGEMT